MAQAPTAEQIMEAQKLSLEALAEKQVLQAEEGKSFNVPADGHGPGVVPEEVWKELKS